MFTGLIDHQGKVRSFEKKEDWVLTLETNFVFESISIGESISCNGVCLTVVSCERYLKGTCLVFEVSEETLNKTSLGQWAQGRTVNLEKALLTGQALGGHMVSGHVDAVIEVLSRKEENGSLRYTFELPQSLRPFISPKGSVCLDGVSLTVNEVEEKCFGVNIISHTQNITTFGALQRGEKVNIEIDLIARYVQRQLAFLQQKKV